MNGERNSSRESSSSNGPVRFVGQIDDRSALAEVGPLTVTARLRGGNRELRSTTIDGGGRFLVRHGDVLEGSAVEFVVQDRSGEVIGRATARYPESGAVTKVTVDVSVRATGTDRSTRSVPPPRHNTDAASGLVSSDALAQLAETLERAAGEHERPQVPRWVNRTVIELDEAGRLAHDVVHGDASESKRFRALLSSPPPGQPLRDIEAGERGPAGGSDVSDGFDADIRSFTGGPGRDRPCLFRPDLTVGVGLAGLLLDVERIDRVGEQGRPSQETKRARAFLRRRHQQLEQYRELAADYAGGRITERAFEELSSVEGSLGEAEPLLIPDIPPGGPGGGSVSPPPGRETDLPGRPSPPNDDRNRCLVWVDCLDEFVRIAEDYQPPARCPREEDIGRITPSAVCEGETDIEIVLHPREGETFPTGGPCFAYLQNGLNYRVSLEVVSITEESITVELPEAEHSGCIGFRPGQSRQGNVSFVRACLKLGAISTSPLIDLLTGEGRPVLVRCNRDRSNRLDVVPEPVLETLNASGPGGSGIHPTSSPDHVTISEEACREVVLNWSFGFDGGADGVDPATYISVEITNSDGESVATGLQHWGSHPVTAREDETYTVTATATADGDECGRAVGTVAVERFHKVHLEELTELRTGHSGELKVRVSCPVLESTGLDVALAYARPEYLHGPAMVTIPQGTDHVFTTVTAEGSGCTTVTVTGTADGHLQSEAHTVEVYDRPKITEVTPSVLDTCRPSGVTVTGSCFAPGRTTVRVIKQEELIILDLTSVTETEIVCAVAEGDTLSPGTWELEVVSRGLQSERIPIQVRPTPRIVEFSALTLPVWPCLDSTIPVTFEVENAENVRLVRVQNGNSTVVQESPNPVVCDPVTGAVSDTAEGSRSYRLEAFPAGGGSPVVGNALVGERPVLRASGFRLTNYGPYRWTIHMYSSKSGEWSQTNLAANQGQASDAPSANVTFEDCTYYYVFAVNRDLMEDAGEDPDDVDQALQTSSDHRWNALDPGVFAITELETPENPWGEFHLLGQADAGFYPATVGGS